MPDSLEIALDRTCGRLTLSCRACGGQHVEEAAQSGVILAAVTASFFGAHADCRESPGAPRPTAPAARTVPTLLEAQLEGIAALARSVAETEASLQAAGSREERMDRARRHEVLRRQHDALVTRLGAEDRRGRSSAAASAVVAHRNAWFTRKVVEALQGQGVEVLATTPNGADAVGIAAAEQPDLLLAEQTLEMTTGLEVVRDVRLFTRSTAVVLQVPHEDAVEPALAAGARAAYPRHVPPHDVAALARALLADPA